MTGAITIRPARKGDSPILHDLAAQGAPYIWVHTPFTYWVLVFNYPDYIFIAEDNGKPIGNVTALPATSPDIGLFIWQITMLPEYRGQGLGKRLMRVLLDRHPRVGRFTVTIDPAHAASIALFEAIADEYGGALKRWDGAPGNADADLIKQEDNEDIWSATLKR